MAYKDSYKGVKGLGNINVTLFLKLFCSVSMLMVSTSPMPRAAMSTILSAPPTCKHALRVSTQACPHAESIILSAGGTESMILSARAESTILSVPPAESMILSQRHPCASVP